MITVLFPRSRLPFCVAMQQWRGWIYKKRNCEVARCIRCAAPCLIDRALAQARDQPVVDGGTKRNARTKHSCFLIFNNDSAIGVRYRGGAVAVSLSAFGTSEFAMQLHRRKEIRSPGCTFHGGDSHLRRIWSRPSLPLNDALYASYFVYDVFQCNELISQHAI